MTSLALLEPEVRERAEPAPGPPRWLDPDLVAPDLHDGLAALFEGLSAAGPGEGDRGARPRPQVPPGPRPSPDGSKTEPGRGAARTESGRGAQPGRGRTRQWTVLVIEDDPLSMITLGETLRARGFQVSEAISGADGLRVAREVAPDVIVLDVALPDAPGVGIARDLKRDPRTRSIPIVAVTAMSSGAWRDQALAAGCAAFMVKPLPLNDLVLLLEDLCRSAED